ncbi:uncharacterized protein LOC111051999 [Nilaparvata lugens]|uniref:uncharacterized protein LOC111051999 n=1 Tax=Nilaparvata lugens TaxID=108931 RepID=UPI00193D8DFE|nr:uncharacterized protein LOC111051999 [Nilaparvata lugens]
MDICGVVLPLEIAEKILSYVGLRELICCSEVSVNWYQLINNMKLWRSYVSSEEDRWLLHYQGSKCNAIVSGFPGEFSGLNVIAKAETLAPVVNPWKNSLRQRNILKHYWMNGIYQAHTLKPEHCNLLSFSSVVVIYPSTAAQDCLYLPILGTRGDGEEGLYLVRLDWQPKIVCTLVENVKEAAVEVTCVMRDYVVWVSGLTVQCLSLQNGVENSEIKTLGEVVENDFFFLAMDIENIVAWSHGWLHLWDKKNLDLKLSMNSRPKTTISEVRLDDGILIVASFQFEKYVSLIEVKDTRNMRTLHEFEVYGFVIDVICCKNNFLLQYHQQLIDRVEGRDRKTAKVRFSREFFSGTFGGSVTRLADSKFIYSSKLDGTVKFDISHPEIDLYKFITIFDDKQPLFGNILVGVKSFSSKCDEIVVWNWVEKLTFCKLRSLQFIKVHINEGRIIAHDEAGAISVMSFG